MRYPVNEIFQTIQGEAAWAGTPSVFIRLQGCGVGCPWCDTKHTWDFGDMAQRVQAVALEIKVGPSPTWSDYTVEDLLAKVQTYAARHVVITGGEPCVHDLNPLCSALLGSGRTVQIETSGTAEIIAPDGVWVTVSPKIRMPGGKAVRADALRRAQELKHPVAIPRNVDELLELVGRHHTDARIWLQPVDGAPRGLETALSACYEHGWRLSVQTHKYIGLR
jgi:7-carboxy-7-deazaguanine synthase